MDDVVAVLHSLVPYFIGMAVLLLLALIITFAVNKKTVQNTANRKLIHSESWIVVLIGMVVAVSMMVSGPLSTLLNNTASTKHELTSETKDRAKHLAEQVQSEAITMLQNKDSNLPLSGKKVNVFGWASSNPIYSGSGSGAMSTQYKTVSIMDGLKQAGLQANPELSQMYTAYRKDRPEIGMWKADWTLPEPTADHYTESLMNNAKKYSGQAVVVIARGGGEHADLPTNMKAKNVLYQDNSKSYQDFANGESYLQLSKTEQDMLDVVAKNFKNVTLVYNGANTLQFDFLSKYPQIKSVLWCPPAGQTGFSALGKVLAGSVNPSGRTSDTFLKNAKQSNTFNNYGDFAYTNADEFAIDGKSPVGQPLHTLPHFINYTEGIYVGYKFYETAAKEGLIKYDDVVQYPFGYGLSYTKFKQSMGKINYANGKISFDVTVTNTGNKPGKDVVETYYNPPYTNGGIEKASTNLVGFEKTGVLKPGASQTVNVSFNDADMASYDSKKAKSYVLEKGDYDISIQSDSHHVTDHQSLKIGQTIKYNSKSNTHDGDKTPATNRFDYTAGDVQYLSRANHFANYAQTSAAPTDFKMSDKAKSEFINNKNYKVADHNKASDKMPTMGAKNNVKLADLRGKSFNDPKWNHLLDELTFDDMDGLIATGGYGTKPIKSIGKVQTTFVDGPTALNNNFTKVGSIGFPAATAVACTWNKGLARQFGEMIGEMARDMHVVGWYAPAMNIHRGPFEGRNFEYFSEDSLLSGAIASSEIAGAKSKGVYAFMKHFVLSEQEIDRTSMLTTWINEQSLRELYLKPFEMSVKTGGAQAVMSSDNFLGPVYAGASAPLLQKVLRDEWGFHGMVSTDYFGNFGFLNADQIIRGGGDVMLATTTVTNHITDKSATSVIAMRRATKNILYATVNGWTYESADKAKSDNPYWEKIMYVVWGVTAVLAIGLEVLAIIRFMRRRNGADAVAVVEADTDSKE